MQFLSFWSVAAVHSRATIPPTKIKNIELLRESNGFPALPVPHLETDTLERLNIKATVVICNNKNQQVLTYTSALEFITSARSAIWKPGWTIEFLSHFAYTFLPQFAKSAYAVFPTLFGYYYAYFVGVINCND